MGLERFKDMVSIPSPVPIDNQMKQQLFGGLSEIVNIQNPKTEPQAVPQAVGTVSPSQITTLGSSTTQTESSGMSPKRQEAQPSLLIPTTRSGLNAVRGGSVGLQI
jgi:hypothetical protein